MQRLTSVDEVPEMGSWLFTVREPDGACEEVILVRSTDGVTAWKNFCQHETDQRLDRGRGAMIRDGEIVCPKHGSMFDVGSGNCTNGKAAGSTLVEVNVTVNHGDVFLTDETLEFCHEGGIDDNGLPDSTSHLSF